jgi:hypothetical protein
MAAVGDSMQLYRDWQQMFKELLEDGAPPCMMNMWSAMKGRLEQVDHGLLMIMLCRMDKGEYLTAELTTDVEHMSKDELIEVMMPYFYHVPGLGVGKGMTGKGELAVVPYPPPIDLYDEAKVARAAASKGKAKGQQQKKRRLGSDDVGTILEMELAEGTLEEDSDGDDSDGDAINDDAGTILEMETEENENEEEDDVGTILEMETEEGVGSDDGQDGVVYVGDEPKFPDEPELPITIEPYIAGQFKPFTIMIEENFRIIGIKVRIGEVLGASARQMKLFMGEKVLVDNMKLSSYGTPNGACLRLAIEDIEGDPFATSKTTKKGPK